ncbi:MAG: methylenetetrahydrofolate reductase [Deltaproteobacteria bacterium]|nr:methylenetetrahydrofolate reductase [Deltaproteobacteria bacterium]
MRISRTFDDDGFVLLAEADPPKGPDLTRFADNAMTVRDRVTAIAVTDCAHAIMRMTPLGPCRTLIERGLKPVMVINGRDRNRLSFQGDLLAAHALGVRDILLREGRDPSIGDQPMVGRSGDLGLDLMLQCLAAFRNGRDLAGEPLDSPCAFRVGTYLNVSGDPAQNGRTIENIGKLSGQGVEFFVPGPTYDPTVVEEFASAAGAAGIRMFASVMLLKSVAMIRYLNGLPGVSPIPDHILKRMMKAPDKVRCGMEIAAGFIRNASASCRGALLVSVGWEPRIGEFPELLALPEAEG